MARKTSRRGTYWGRNLRHVIVLLGIWFAVSLGAGVLFVDVLSRVRLGDSAFKARLLVRTARRRRHRAVDRGFARTNLLATVAGKPYEDVPEWFRGWEPVGLITLEDRNGDRRSSTSDRAWSKKSVFPGPART